MTEISRYVAGPYQGVSQVPPQDRLEGSCQAMENCLAVIPNGIQKRPPYEYFKKLVSFGGTASAYFGEIPRGDPAQDATLVLTNDGGNITPRLFNSNSGDAIAFTSLDSAAQAYLNSGNPDPSRDLRVFPIEDVTFIVNRLVQVDTVADTAPVRPFEAIIWVKTGAYARNTGVTIAPFGGIQVGSAYKPAAGGSAADANGVGTDRIAEGLLSGTIPAGSNATHAGGILSDLTGQGFTIFRIGSIIYLSHPTTDFQIQVEDDQGGTAVTTIKNSVQRFSDLPAVAVDGFTVRVAQEAAGGNSDYYVRFEATTSNTEGVWKEVVAPGAPLGLDPTSMPVAITRNDTLNEWKLESLPWTGRTTGNATLSPDPDFVGDYIRDIKWFRGRLALQARNSTYLSASDSPYKFYTTTLATSLPSDPIGYLTPADRKAFFEELVAFDERMVSFADKVQGIISSGDTLSAGTSKMTLLGNAAFAPQVRVQKAYNKAYFAASRTKWLALFELSVDRISGLVVPEELTPAVPALLPSTVDRAATYETDYMSFYGASGASTIYTHTYRHAEQVRVQNGWHPWVLPSGYTLAHMFMKGTILNSLLLETSSGALIWFKQELSPDTVDPAGTILTHLDLRVSGVGLVRSYDPVLDQTTITLPYNAAGTIGSVGFGNLDYPEGYAPEVLSRDATHLVLRGDWVASPMWFGKPYTSYFIPSRWYNYGQDGKPIRAGRLVIRKVRWDVDKLGTLRVEVMIRNKGWIGPKVWTYDGLTFNESATPLDAPVASQTTTLVTPILGHNEMTEVRVINDSHYGFKLVGYEWTGDFNARARRQT